MENKVPPKKCYYVVLNDLPFCRLDLGHECHKVVFHDDIWKYRLTYEQLMERLKEAENV